jgi:phospholipid/cholesterol/gamma-HCH transport system permease protein
MTPQTEPTLTITLAHASDGGGNACVSGAWLVHVLAQPDIMPGIQTSLKQAKKAQNVTAGLRWDLSQVTGLDHIGAQLLWNAWGKARPQQLQLSHSHETFFRRLEQVADLGVCNTMPEPKPWIISFGLAILGFLLHLLSFVALIGQLTLDSIRLVRHPLRGPWKEISANIFHAGFQALGITGLVGFLIGVVLSYLSAQQLRSFGADTFLVNILGLSIIRELGPVLAAILVAGRSGSSITAQLGVMRVTEELDAMLVMGISHGFRLILPRVIALAISMPLLVVWTDTIALIGGMVSAKIELGMSPEYFFHALPAAVPVVNYWIGLAKGVMFGMLIALVSCHFGLRIKPNTESLGHGTTTSVVTAITVVILADAIFAIIFNGVGY